MEKNDGIYVLTLGRNNPEADEVTPTINRTSKERLAHE
jgi:hypothetical protein